METTFSTTSARGVKVLATSIVAGIIGGLGIELYLFLFVHLTPLQHWHFVASTLVGPVAYGSATYALLGAVTHYLISIVWALMYVLLAQRWSAFYQQPWIWGVVFGIVVMIGMTSILIIKHVAAGPPTGMMLVGSLASHIVFFGLPAALYVSAAFRRDIHN